MKKRITRPKRGLERFKGAFTLYDRLFLSFFAQVARAGRLPSQTPKCSEHPAFLMRVAGETASLA